MHRAVVSLPDGLDQKGRWLLGELCSAAGVRVAEGAPALPIEGRKLQWHIGDA